MKQLKSDIDSIKALLSAHNVRPPCREAAPEPSFLCSSVGALETTAAKVKSISEKCTFNACRAQKQVAKTRVDECERSPPANQIILVTRWTMSQQGRDVRGTRRVLWNVSASQDDGLAHSVGPDKWEHNVNGSSSGSSSFFHLRSALFISGQKESHPSSFLFSFTEEIDTESR